MKTIIAGSRTITDYSLVKNIIRLSQFNITEVVCGWARGVDKLGKEWADENGVITTGFNPDWETFGKRAGYLRNLEMAKYANALIAIWDGISKGTKHMIDIAKARNLKVFVYDTSNANTYRYNC
jgi:glycerophosphoryl diester phosphodiesterase